MNEQDQGVFNRNVRRELKKIRKEVEKTCAVTKDVYPAPESAYAETISVLKRMSRDIPAPDMMWLEDGGIGLEWRPENGIATMSLYGDNQVIFGASWQKQREIWGSCTLSDPVLLPNFLKILSEIFQK